MFVNVLVELAERILRFIHSHRDQLLSKAAPRGEYDRCPEVAPWMSHLVHLVWAFKLRLHWHYYLFSLCCPIMVDIFEDWKIQGFLDGNWRRFCFPYYFQCRWNSICFVWGQSNCPNHIRILQAKLLSLLSDQYPHWILFMCYLQEKKWLLNGRPLFWGWLWYYNIRLILLPHLESMLLPVVVSPISAWRKVTLYIPGAGVPLQWKLPIRFHIRGFCLKWKVSFLLFAAAISPQDLRRWKTPTCYGHSRRVQLLDLFPPDSFGSNSATLIGRQKVNRRRFLLSLSYRLPIWELTYISEKLLDCFMKWKEYVEEPNAEDAWLARSESRYSVMSLRMWILTLQ